MSLRHAHNLISVDYPGRGPAWPWVVAGVVLLGIAAAMATSAMRSARGVDVLSGFAVGMSPQVSPQTGSRALLLLHGERKLILNGLGAPSAQCKSRLGNSVTDPEIWDRAE